MTSFWEMPRNVAILMGAVAVVVGVAAGVLGYAIGQSSSQRLLFQSADTEPWTDAHGWTP
jgi:hypothetical protein